MTTILMGMKVSGLPAATGQRLTMAGSIRNPRRAPTVGRQILEARTPIMVEEVKELQNGVALSNQKGDQDEVQVYRLPVPALHKADCKTQGFKGDPDLYLRFGETPDITFEISDNACASAYEGTTETCSTGSSGMDDSILFVALHAYESYQGITLVCIVYPSIAGQSPSEAIMIKDQVIELKDGEAKVNQNGAKGEVQLYRLMVASQQQTYCELSGGKGDADMYIRFNQVPEVSVASTNNDCVSVNERSYEYCSTSSSSNTDGTLYVAVHAYEAYRGVQLSCYSYSNQWDDDTHDHTHSWGKTRVPEPVFNELVLELTPYVPLKKQKGTQDAVQLYTLTVPPMHRAVCSTEGSVGDADIYMRFGEIPEIRFDSTVNDCISAWDSSYDSCDALSTNNEETILYVALHAYEAYRDLTIACQLDAISETPIINEEILVLDMGIPLTNQNSLENEVKLYQVSVPSGHQVTCSTSGDNGDVDLLVRVDGMPDLDFFYNNDCTSVTVGSNEECTITNYWGNDMVVNVGLHAYEAYAGLSIVCTSELA